MKKDEKGIMEKMENKVWGEEQAVSEKEEDWRTYLI